MDEITDEALEAARATRADDPEGWDATKTAYAEARRAQRLAQGRAIGPPPWPADVVEYMKANPDAPNVVAAREEQRAALQAQLAELEG